MVDSNLVLGRDQKQVLIDLSPWDHLMKNYLRRYLSPKERTTTPVSTRGPRATLAHRGNRLGQRQLQVRYCIEPI